MKYEDIDTCEIKENITSVKQSIDNQIDDIASNCGKINLIKVIVFNTILDLHTELDVSYDEIEELIDLAMSEIPTVVKH